MGGDLVTPIPTQHALTRLVDMDVKPREVQLALTAPEHKRRHQSEPRFEYWRRGRLDLVVDTVAQTVVTALWSDVKHWSHDERTIRSRGGKP